MVDYNHFNYLWLMKKVVKLTEKDLSRIIEKVILEQGTINLPTKGLKPVFEPSKVSQIKSQANDLAGNNLIMMKVLQAMKQVDPEAYHMITKGTDPVERTPVGDAVIGGTLISLIYTLVQELKGE